MGVDLDTGRGPKRVKPVMNITPLLTKQLWLVVPPKVDADQPPPPPDAVPPLVLTVEKDGVTRVNGEAIPRAELAARLVRMLNARPDKVVFFDADSSMDYGAALDVMDAVRLGGVQTLAVLADETASTGGVTGSP